MPALSKRTWLGIAREAVPGTAITTPTRYIPCKSTVKGTVKNVILDEERGTRDAAYGHVQTTREGSIDVKGSFYPDSFGYLLLGALGSVTSTQPDNTGNPLVYKHAFALADIPPSFTCLKNYDTKAYYMPYSVVEKVNIKFTGEGKLMDLDSSLKSLFPQVLGTALPAPSFSTVNPLIGYAPQLTLGGIVTTDIDDVSIDFNQKITLWYPISGSQDWVTAYFGERSLKVDFTARFDTTTIYDRFRNHVQDSLIIDVKGDNISNTYYNEFYLQIPYMYYDSAEHDTGKDNVLIKAKATAVNAGPNGLIQSCYLQNTYTNYTN